MQNFEIDPKTSPAWIERVRYESREVVPSLLETPPELVVLHTYGTQPGYLPKYEDAMGRESRWPNWQGLLSVVSAIELHRAALQADSEHVTLVAISGDNRSRHDEIPVSVIYKEVADYMLADETQLPGIVFVTEYHNDDNWLHKGASSTLGEINFARPFRMFPEKEGQPAPLFLASAPHLPSIEVMLRHYGILDGKDFDLGRVVSYEGLLLGLGIYQEDLLRELRDPESIISLENARFEYQEGKKQLLLKLDPSGRLLDLLSSLTGRYKHVLQTWARGGNKASW